MTEKIQNPNFLIRKRGNHASPDRGGLLASHRLATLGLDQFQSDRFRVSAKIHRLHIQRIRRQIRQIFFWWQGYSSSTSPNVARNSGELLRTSSHSKKASGVSSQMRNHSAISFFSSRFCDSTLRLCEIISARRLPRRAISRTRSTAAFSPWARKRRASSSRRVRLTSAS